MDVLLENAKQVASAHREAQRQAALQTDLDMLENAESVATALELEEQEAANKAVEELEAAIRLGVELDEKEEEAEQSRRDEDAETTETLQEIEELEAKREEQRLALIEAADKVMAATLAKQIERQEKQVAKLEARGEKLAQKLMAKEDMNVAVQLAKEIDEQETKMIAQWNKDLKLAQQLSREEKVAANQASKAEAQDRMLARKLTKELNGTDGLPTKRDKMREKLGNLRRGLTELTGNNGNVAVSTDKLIEPLAEP